MQPNINPVNPSSLNNASHSKSYDPSAPYRMLMMPPPPGTARISSNNPHSLQNVPFTNIDPKTGVVKRIPQFYYPRYDDANDHNLTQPNVVDQREINPNLPPHVVERPVPNEFSPYPYQVPLHPDPYASGQYYPYNSAYPPPEDTSKTDIIAAHQQDADLSRLEVYHFTPKQNTSLPTAAPQAQPLVQYHVYPYPPSQGPLPPPPTMPLQQPPQQQPPSYPPSWYYAPNAPPYASEPSQPVLPYIETRARGSQTEEPSTKSRGISPINFYTPPAPVYDDDGYPYIHQKSIHTDQHNITTGRINRRFYDSNRSTPIADCRCLDCQRERSKILNYYPD